MNTTIDDFRRPAILAAQKDLTVTGANRYLAAQALVDPAAHRHELLKAVYCPLKADALNRISWESVRLPKSVRPFQLVDFRASGITARWVEESFRKAGLRPANLLELLSFVAAQRDYLRQHVIIALGSSDAEYLDREYARLPVLVRAWRSFRGVARPVPVCPILETCYPEKYARLKLSEGIGGWQSHVIFLGVFVDQSHDRMLVDYEISMEEYLKLPPLAEFTEEQVEDEVPLGTLVRAPDGHLRKLVSRDDAFAHQMRIAAPMSRNRTWRYYRPVFVDAVPA